MVMKMKIDAIEYLYRPTLRPPSFCTLPGIEWDYVEAPASDPSIAMRRGLPLSRYQFGIIATTRRLTPDERSHYGLELA
jgi:hypothetical protein